MSKLFFKYPSIRQFRDVATETVAKYSGIDDSKLKATYRRTIKLHGSNSSIVFPLNGTNEIYAQSRNRIITPENDNAGFARWVEDNSNSIQDCFYEHMPDQHEDWTLVSHIVVYGEWCGQGIQKGTALNQLPKMFVVFGVRVIYNSDVEDTRNRWSYIECQEEDILTNTYKYAPFSEHSIGMYNINEFNTTDIVEIDFSNPVETQRILLEDVEKVGACCPLALALGATGTGEGYVYEPLNGVYHNSFKVKSKSHSVSKTEHMSEENLKQMESCSELADKFLTLRRYYQGLDYLVEMDIDPYSTNNVGHFIKWVVGDIKKEHSEMVAELGFKQSIVNMYAAKHAKEWFFNNIVNQAKSEHPDFD